MSSSTKITGVIRSIGNRIKLGQVLISFLVLRLFSFAKFICELNQTIEDS